MEERKNVVIHMASLLVSYRREDGESPAVSRMPLELVKKDELFRRAWRAKKNDLFRRAWQMKEDDLGLI